MFRGFAIILVLPIIYLVNMEDNIITLKMPNIVDLHKIIEMKHPNVMACLLGILEKYFLVERSVLIILPEFDGALNDTAVEVLESTFKRTILPVVTSTTTNRSVWIEIERDGGYLILLWGMEDEESISDYLLDLLEFLQHTPSWNPRGKFIVAVSESSNTSSISTAKYILKTIWNSSYVVNIVIFVVSSLNNYINLYTWFPYKSGQCGKVENVVLLDICVSERFLWSSELFTSKIPNNLNGCALRISTWDFAPYAILVDNYTDDNGEIIYKYSGFEVEYLILASEAMNMKLVYRHHETGPAINTFMGQIQDIADARVSDIAVGAFPLHPFILYYADATIPHMFTSVKWFVPCAKPMSRMKKILHMFRPSLWITLSLIFLLAAIVIWKTAKRADPEDYRKFIDCVYNVWAIILGVSVPKLPRSSSLRLFFLVFLLFAFSLNILFQALIVSFLIEPGYEKQIETFDQLVESGLKFAEHPLMKNLFIFTSYQEQKRLKSVECLDYEACLEDLINGESFTTIGTQFHAEYKAVTLPGSGTPCSLDADIASGGVVMYIGKGNPLLPRLNSLIRKCLEAGLGIKYWSDYTRAWKLKTEVDLSSGEDGYFVFTIIHLQVPFMILGLGTTLGLLMFLSEIFFRIFVMLERSEMVV
ncbi:Ionotropic receptor 251 [Blattella germanica]|nr:Ionotropic receptor 251 [Blattella germanica]